MIIIDRCLAAMHFLTHHIFYLYHVQESGTASVPGVGSRPSPAMDPQEEMANAKEIPIPKMVVENV